MTNDPELADKIRRLRSHGITSDPALMQSRPENEIWNYQQIELGFNYRMTDIHAALGLSQLDRLDDYVNRRHAVAKTYNAQLSELPLQLPFQHPEAFSSLHLYPIRVSESGAGPKQRQVYDRLQAAGINVNLHYIPVYRQPYYTALGFKAGYCPEAERYFREAISMPIYPTLAPEQIDYIINSTRALFV